MPTGDAITALRLASHSGDAVKLAVFGAFALATPALSRRVAESPRARRVAWVTLGLSIFAPIYASLGGTSENYDGIVIYRDAFSFEITIVDLLALLLLLSHRRRGMSGSFPGPLLGPRALFLAAVLVSLFASASPGTSLFSVFKILRAYFVFGVVATGFRELSAVRACTTGLAIGAALQAPLALVQHFLWGVARPSGTIGGSNNLSLVLHLVGPTAVALVLAGRASKWAACAAAAWVTLPLLGRSRTGTLVVAAGVLMVVAGSLAREVTPRKLRTLRLSALLAVVPLASLVPGVLSRWQGHIDWPWISRMRLSSAARAMIHDHPWGVGVNMYGWVQSAEGYGRLAGLNKNGRELLVHNYYYLITAELGWIGLVAFVIVLASIGARAARAARVRDVRGDVALGALVSLVLFALTSWNEMAPTARQPMYAFWIVAAIACSIGSAREEAT